MPLLRDILESAYQRRTPQPEADLWNLIIPEVDPFRQTSAEFAAGVTPTNYWVPSHDGIGKLLIRRYGGAPGAGDNTAAMDQAEAVAAQLGSGVIALDRSGVWLMNWTCTTPGVWVEGCGGRAEFDTFCIRPFSIATGPAMTFGDGTTTLYYCGLYNIHMSGTNGTAGADRQVAKSASHCLLIKGGVINFTSIHSWFYNGIRTVSLEPSATNPVTGARFIGGGARNDLFDSASARTIYGKRPADPGYYTDNIFDHFKINGPGDRTANPTNGYACEFDGTGGPGIIAEITNCYIDCAFDFTSKATVCHGILLKSAASIRCKDMTLDPGTTGAVVIETDQPQTSPTRVVFGTFSHGGQIMKFAAGATVALPAEANNYQFKSLFQLPYIIGPISLTYTLDPFDVGGVLPTIDSDSTTGPITFNRTDLSVKTAGKGLRVKEGSNCKQGTAVLVAGTVVVANTSVTASSRIIPARSTLGGTPGHLSYTISAGVSFTITSSSAADTSTIVYEIFEPA